MRSKNIKPKVLDASYGDLAIFSESIDLKLNKKWPGTKIYSAMAHTNFEFNMDPLTTETSPIYEPHEITSCQESFKPQLDQIRYEMENSKKFLKNIYSFKISNKIKQEDQSILSQIDLIGSKINQEDEDIYKNDLLPKDEITDKSKSVNNSLPKNINEVINPAMPQNETRVKNLAQDDLFPPNDSNEQTIALLKKTARISRGPALHFLSKNSWDFQVAFEESRESKANEDSICVYVKYDGSDDPLSFILNPQQKLFLIYAQISDSLENKGMKGPFQLTYKGIELIPQKLNSALTDLGMSREEIIYLESSCMN